jgi:hypothetical protein
LAAALPRCALCGEMFFSENFFQKFFVDIRPKIRYLRFSGSLGCHPINKKKHPCLNFSWFSGYAPVPVGEPFS